MPTVEVLNVSQPPDPSPELQHIGLDVAVPDGWDQFALPVAGHAIGHAGGPRVKRVEALCGTKVVHTARLIRDRKNAPPQGVAVPDDLPWRFEMLVGVIGLPAEFELNVVAVLQDDRRIEVGSVSAQHEPVRSGFEPQLQPLMVTSLGRTGSTRLMRTLGSHPRIVVLGGHPSYEMWPARYWMHVFKVLAHPLDARSDTAYDFDQDEQRVGHNPYYFPRLARAPQFSALFGRAHVERLAAFIQARVDEWYTTGAPEKPSGDETYFAEKQLLRPDATQPVLWELYPSARELFLVRDFRDAASSAVAYSEQRGHPMMGWTHRKSAEQYVREDLRLAAADFLEAWQSRQERAHLVRYEDLIQRPLEALTGVLTYLGLESSEEIVEGMLHQGQGTEAQRQTHTTSTDDAASIGRWRDEADSRLRAALEESFTDLIPHFGYRD